MAHIVTAFDGIKSVKYNHFLVSICGSTINDRTIVHVTNLNNFIACLTPDKTNEKVHRLYFLEMVDHDYSFDHDFYQFMLTLMYYGHLTARTVFDVLIKPPGKVAPLLHSDIEMVPSQVFYDWCYRSNICKRINTGLDQDEIDLIKSHNFEQILRNFMGKYGNNSTIEKVKEIFPIPSVQVNLEPQKLPSVTEETNDLEKNPEIVQPLEQRFEIGFSERELQTIRKLVPEDIFRMCFSNEEFE